MSLKNILLLYAIHQKPNNKIPDLEHHLNLCRQDPKLKREVLTDYYFTLAMDLKQKISENDEFYETCCYLLKIKRNLLAWLEIMIYPSLDFVVMLETIFFSKMKTSAFDFFLKHSFEHQEFNFLEILSQKLNPNEAKILFAKLKFQNSKPTKVLSRLLEVNAIENLQNVIYSALLSRISTLAKKHCLTLNQEALPLVLEELPEFAIINHKDLVLHCFSSVYEFRTQKLWEIICGQCSDALMDLKLCLLCLQNYMDFLEKVKMCFKTRLLHPGASSVDVIQVYLDSFKVFQVLDPSGSLLQESTDGLWEYFKSRKDSVKSILEVLFMKDYGCFFQGDEIVLGSVCQLQQSYNDDLRYEPTLFSTKSSSCDVLQVIVNMYKSKEVFLKEYQQILADKILNFKFVFDEELENVEKLKSRFGSDSLLLCDAMLRDVKESSRLNLNVFVCSHVFWPSFQEVELFHPKIMNLLDEIQLNYQRQKQGRKLVFLGDYGEVQLELFDEMVKCSLIQASVLFFVEENQSLDDLQQKTKLNPQKLLRILMFWMKRGFISRQNNMYYLQRNQMDIDDEEQEEPKVQKSNQTIRSFLKTFIRQKPQSLEDLKLKFKNILPRLKIEWCAVEMELKDLLKNELISINGIIKCNF